MKNGFYNGEGEGMTKEDSGGHCGCCSSTDIAEVFNEGIDITGKMILISRDVSRACTNWRSKEERYLDFFNPRPPPLIRV